MKQHILVLPMKANLYSRKDIELNGVNYTMFLYTYGNNSGFVHFSELYKDFDIIASAKAQYYNRTWERYTGESVYRECLNYAIKSNDITTEDKTALLERLGGY